MFTLYTASPSHAHNASVDEKIEFPDLEQDYEFVALRHPDEYPFNEGRLVSGSGLDIDIAEYEEWFEERHVRHSNALHSRIPSRGPYLVGPMARFNLWEFFRPFHQPSI